MITIPSFTISLIYYPFFEWNIREAQDIKSALVSFGNKVFLHLADHDLIYNLQKQPLDIVFNLTRNPAGTVFDYTVSGICELLEIALIGPKIFTASVCRDKEMLTLILKHDGVPILTKLEPPKFPGCLQVFLLESTDPLIFIKPPSKMTINSQAENKIKQLCKKIFQSIHCSNFCEFEIYLDQNVNPVLLNVNILPNLEKIADFASTVKNTKGIDYNKFINLIVLNAASRANLPVTGPYLSLKTSLKSAPLGKPNSGPVEL
jgi:D-alanine-D-alanine ligase-like ATP-grasp enzyme